MKFLDICAGIGGFRSGLEQAGHECIGYVEIDKYARLSYEAMYDTKGEWTEKDVTKIDPNELPRADCWCFGFPCQDISVAGSQKGLAGKRSGIFYSIIELLKSQNTEDRPEWLLIENVKNLLSLHGGREFTEVLFEISEAGYDVEWHLINSKDHGVPQNRERVFIIGHLRETSRSEVLPITRTSEQINREAQSQQQTRKGESESERQEKFGDRFNHLIGNRKYQNSHVYGTDGVSRACDTSGEIYYAIPKVKLILNDPVKNKERVASSDGISRCLTATDYKEPQKIAIPTIESFLRGKVYQDYVQSSDGLSRTITARDYKDPQKIAIPKQIIPGNQAHRVYDSDGLSVTVKAEGGGVGAKSGLYAIPKINRVINSTQHFSVVNTEGISPAISACDYKDPQKVTVTINDLYGKKFSDTRNNCIHSWDISLKGECSKDEKSLLQSILDHRRHKEFGDKDGNPLSAEQIKTFTNFNDLEGMLKHLTEMGYLKKIDDKYDMNFGQLSYEISDILDPDKPVKTLTSTDCHKHGVMVYNGKEYNIRRLTPKECFRLQGFSDEQFEKAKAVNSNTQLYKQAGNAVTVNVARVLGELLNI